MMFAAGIPATLRNPFGRLLFPSIACADYDALLHGEDR